MVVQNGAHWLSDTSNVYTTYRGRSMLGSIWAYGYGTQRWGMGVVLGTGNIRWMIM